ncbi:Cytochrome P450 [Macleaya cordata]|uniref:Cytochrome P450 n=1 Tax=Macleaya cordata TaxID=56857 RepID=A0A200R9Z3_MACCD|nr:Cytochrome P450 [Macleaya cordata]
MTVSAGFFQKLTTFSPHEIRSWLEEDQKDLPNIKSSLTLITFLAFSLLFCFIWMIYFRSSKKNQRLPPGPRGLPLVGNLLSLDPELHTYFTDLAQKFGPIYKLQLGNKLGIVVSSPTLAKEVLKDYDTTFANRDVPAAGRTVAYGGSDIVWNPYGPEWRMLRKVCVREMLSNASLDAVYSLRHREVRRLVRHVHSKIGSPMDVGEQMFLTILNVITSMLWGGTLKGDERTTLGAEFRQVVSEITELLGTPNVSDFFPSLARFDVQGIQKKIRVLFMRFDKIFDLIIEQRLKMEAEGEEESSNKDFLQLLLKLKDEEDAKTPFTMKHLKALLMDMVVGGTETTSNTVEWAIAELMNKPEMMRRAQEELERVVGKDNSVEESHLPHLPYLHSVMKEVLRLHPALPLLVPHCPSLSCTVGGYLVPKGARVFVNVWAIHRDPSIWVNPSEFDPDRFFNGQGDFSGNDFNYFPFGSGRRICAGIPMAERMVMYELATLLHLFEWRLPEGAKLDLKENSSKPNQRLPPGPRGLPIIGNLPFLDPELHTYFAELTQTYGPIFKLKLGTKWAVVVSSPSLAKEVLKDHDKIFANRDVPVAGLLATYGGADIVSAPHGPVWRMLRRICVREMLSNTTLDSVYWLRRREVRRTVREIYSKIGSPIDVGEQMFITISNVITSMMWGGTLKGDETVDSLGGEFRKVVSEITTLLGTPNVSDFFPGLGWFDLQGIERKMKVLFSRYDKIFDLIIEKRLKMEAKGENEESNRDFLQFLLELKEKGGDSKLPFTMEHLKALLINLVVGGTDTSAVTVEWAMAELIKHPEIMKRAQEELEDVVGRNNNVEESHLPKLPYLAAILKETLRLHPPVPLLVSRCPRLSCNVGGYMIPKKAQVLVNAWGIQRDPKNWDNPLEFKPERFLKNTNKLDFIGTDFRFIPFGSGRRKCVGIPLVERMVPYTLASLLHSFEWRMPEGVEIDLSDKFGIVLKKRTPLIAIPIPRLSDSELYS